MDTKYFPVDVIVESYNLCNLEREAEDIERHIENGHRLVIFGRRNTGKSSLVRKVVIPKLEGKKNRAPLAIFADLMSVADLEDLSRRIQRGLEQAISRKFPIQSTLQSVVSLLKSLRPVLKTDTVTGELGVSIDIEQISPAKSLNIIFENINLLHKKYGVFIALDEFQDIAQISVAQGILRDCLQNLPQDLPVVVMGSKKHMLAHIFARPKAPLAGWGIDFEIPTIKTDAYRSAYLRYANERLSRGKIKIDKHEMDYLIDRVFGVPEAVNIVCQTLLQNFSHPIKRLTIDQAILKSVELRQSRYGELLGSFRSVDQKVLRAIAKFGPIDKPKSKEFFSKVPSLSPTGIYQSFKRLEWDADIYRESDGYVVAEPLFSEYLRQT